MVFELVPTCLAPCMAHCRPPATCGTGERPYMQTKCSNCSPGNLLASAGQGTSGSVFNPSRRLRAVGKRGPTGPNVSSRALAGHLPRSKHHLQSRKPPCAAFMRCSWREEALQTALRAQTTQTSSCETEHVQLNAHKDSESLRELHRLQETSFPHRRSAINTIKCHHSPLVCLLFAYSWRNPVSYNQTTSNFVV